MNTRNRTNHSKAKRLLSLLLSLALLFTMSGGAVEAFVVPAQAAAAGVVQAAGHGVSGLQSFASSLPGRFGGAFTRFSAWMLSIMPDPDADPEPEPEPEPDTGSHSLTDVYWNVNPNTVELETVIIYGGNDDNSGADEAHPVLTWEKALSLAAPGATVWVMDQESFTADETRSGAVPDGNVTLRFHDNNTSMFSVAENAALTLENIGLIDENNPDPTVERRLALLQNSALRLGGNVSAKGLLVVEQLLPVETPLVTVTEVPGADFINNAALQFRFDIDDPTYHNGDLNAASYLTRDGGRDVVELVEFPEGYDASSLINNETGPNAVTLHPSLTDETALLYVWRLRTKLGAPNVIEAYLAEKYDGVIYLSGLGDDANRGLYPDEPVRTYARAVAILTGEDAAVNTYRAEHGGYAPGYGVIRIVGAPVEVADGEAWAMPTDTSWVNASNNTVSPSWVERYKYYSGALISVGSGVHFTVNGVTVKGNKAEVPNAVGSVIGIADGGEVTLNTGALLTENHAENGGGVSLNGTSAKLTLSGGAITKCAAVNGGGIYAESTTLNLGSGEISGNSAVNGGGVYSRTSYFAMTGGEIKSNSADNGAGVYLVRDENDQTGGAFTPSFLFSGGAIKSNNATANGGGLYLCAEPAGTADQTRVELTAHGEGEGILNNTATRGGGVYSKEDVTILAADADNGAISAAEGVVSTATVSGNIAYLYGGGWYMDGNNTDDGIRMTLNGGEISGNAVNTNPAPSANFSAVGGGGACIVKGRLTLTGGASIHDNEIVGRHHYYYLRGAGVYMTDPLSFHLFADSEIASNSMRLSGNDNYDYMYGGGVYLLGNSTLAENGDPADFTVEGSVHDNTLTNGGRYNYVQPIHGCGMYVASVPLTVSGGKFNNNKGKINYGRAYGIGLMHTGSRLIVNNNAEFCDNTVEITNSSNSGSYVYGHVYGGGLNKYEGTLTVEDASFLRNTAVNSSGSPAPRQGGGAYLDSFTSATITDTVFEDNGARFTSGGALCVSTTKLNYSTPNYMNGTLTVTDTEFTNNTAFADGAVYVEVTRQTTFTGCTFTGNRATSTEGGALTLMDRNVLGTMNATIDGCVFQKNTAATNAGAMLLGGTSTTYALNVTVKNSTFGGDAAEQGNRAMLAASDSSVGSCGGAVNNRCAKLTLGGGNVIKNNTAVNGGGIYNNSTALTLSAAEGETPTVITANTASNGAGIYNYSGSVTVNAADLAGNVTGDDVKGPAVYNNTGTVYFDASQSDADGIYLNARLHPVLLTGAPAADWNCEMDLNVSDGGSKFVAGDSVVEPASPLTDAAPYENNFVLIRDAAAAYDIVAVAMNLVLAPRAVYIDGVDGDDLNSGSKPTQAVKTFARASELLADLLNANPTAEKKIYIVNTVTVSETELWSFDGFTMPAVDDECELTGEMIPITGVLLQAYIADNRLKAADKALVLVDGGDLTFDSMTLDGNRASFPNQCANFGFKALHNGKLTILGDASGEDPETDVYAAVQNHYAAIYAAGTAADENDRPALRIDDTLIKDCNSTGTIYTNNTGYSAGVTVCYGTLTMDNTDISNCITRSYGGGLYMNNVTAELNAVKVRNSRVNTSAGKYGSYTDGFSAYNGSGGGVYAADSTVTMTGCEVSGCGKGAQGNSSGSGVSVLRGTFNAFDCLFTNNGYVATGNSYVAENSASGGAVWVCGDVTADFTRCAFTKNSAYCGGALCLEIASGAAPTVTVSGCTFGGTDTADKNTSYQAGAAIFSHGNGDVRPTLSLGSYTDPETGEVTRTLIQNNLTGFIPYHGAVYLSFTDFTAENTDFADNQINPPNSTVSSRHGANSAFHPGGAAVYSYSGTAAYKNCTFTNNAVMKVVLQNQNNALPVGGAVFTQGSCAVTAEGCTFTGNYMTNYENNSSVSQMQGSAICVRGGSLTARDCVFKNNKITVTQGDGGAILNDIRVQGTLAIENGVLVVERCEFDGNQLITPNRSRFYTRGSAIHTYACDVTIKDLVSKNGSSVFGVAVALGSNTRNSFEGNIDITDGDIALSGSAPISLAGPLTGTGDIRLRYDETFLGRHVVCGYADGYHNEAPAAGQTLDAEIYLASDAAACFVPAALPEYQHLGLAAGTGEYDLDIVVKNETDVYLDGHNGLDAVIDGDTLIYQTDGAGVLHDGSSPDQAFKTFACAKKALETTAGGGNIVVCGQVTVAGEETWSLEEMTVNGETWTPRLVRFMNPYKSADGNKRDATDTELKTRYTGYLIDIPAGGSLTLENIEVSGMFAACERPRPGSSLILVSGGNLTLGQGSHLTDNDASSTGGAVRVDSGYAEMTDNALIDFCWVDTNYGSYFMDTGHGYGGAVYVGGGEFRMTGADSKITDCGSTYVMNYERHCYGALVYASGGKFRQYAGTLANARVWCKGTFWNGQEWTANYFYRGYFYGAVYAAGARYNAEADTGSLIEIGGTIDNCFRVGPLTNSIWNTSFYGTSISGKGGTIRLLGAGTVPGTRSGEVTVPGALIKNSYQGEYSTAIVYLMAGDSADTGTLFEMYGGEIIDAITSSHTYDINLQKYTRMDMYGGVIRSAYCTYVVYVYDNARFNMRNGEIVRTHTNGGATIYTSSSGAFVMDDGSIHCADNVKPDLTALTNYGYATINGGSIYHFGSDCILTSSKSLTINGGSISDSRYSGIRQDSGTVTVNGGEIFNNSRALVMNGGTATFNKADIYGNTAAGFKVQSGSATLKITSNDVKVHNNPAYEAPIFISSGTLNMTGGLVYENRSPNGGVRVDPSGNATIQNCRFYDNTATSRGGGIWINAGDSKTYTISNVEIDHNTAPSGGGMALHYNQSGSTTYTSTFNVSDVHIHDNHTTTSVGGGLFLEAYTTGTRTMNVNLNRVFIENNIAGNEGTSCSAGGVYMGIGQDTTTANPKTLTVNVDFNGCTVQNNTATGNGGGVFVNRAKRNDVRVNVNFRKSEADNTETRIVNNTADLAGGGIFISSSTPLNSNQTVGNKDISVVLSDATMAQNTAGGSGGAIHANYKSAVYLNNVRVTGNTAGANGGALSGKGGAMFYVTQGVYSGNTAGDKGNGFYMADADLKLVNNYAQIAEDNEIYVDDVAHPIVMQSSFTKKSSVYNVYPGDAYVAGSIVVHPGRFYDGYCPDASPYLRNFYSVRPGTVIDRQYPDLIIGRILFLDGENGLDPIFNTDGTVAEYLTDDLGVTHTGATPDTAFKTFKACKTALGDAPGGIYVCGTVHYLQENEDELDVWSLGEAQYLRRYCGFKVSTEKTYPAFTGDMVSVEQGGLTLTSLTAEGVYKTEEGFTAAGSVFVVNGDDAVLTVAEGAKITENRSTVNGAAVRILKGQMLMSGGEISGNSVTGSAKGAAIWQGDTLTLSGNTLKIEGEVYLAAGATASQETVIGIVPYTYEQPVEGGEEGETETVTVSALDFAPADGSYILVNAENPYDGRDIAAYPAGETPEEAQKGRFQLAASLASLYVLDNEVTRPNILELKIPNQIYLDGVNGDDDNDGLTPARAVKTLQRAYELIRDFPESAVSGGLINVVDTVAVDSAVTLSQVYASGGVTVDAGGPVVFKRYAQPTAYDTLTGFEKPTNLNALFSVASGGALELANVTVDGHSHAVSSGSAEQVSAAVTANAALIDVAEGGSFTLSGGRLQNASASDEANAGAVSINGGTADITGVIANAENAAGVSIYDNGSLNLYGSAAIDGGVYLAQDATYVTVPADFAPANPVWLIPNSAFDGRPMVRYDDSLGEPGLTQKQQWKIADDILAVYSLNNRTDDKQMLELQLKGAVYINGVGGSDANDGKTPETAVKTLKKAYTLLVDKDGATIYVVDTVTLTASAVLDHGLYLSGADVIDAGDDVQFIRYAQPSDYNAEEPGDLAGFGKPSCTGALLVVPSGVSLAATGISFDGHSYDVTDSVARYNSSGVKAADALLRVNVGGTADLSEKVSLQNNSNSLIPDEGKGGTIANYGTVILGGVSIANNEAAYGSGVYQSGTLKVDGVASPDVAADQIVYLTGMQGAADERLITVTGALPAGFTLTVDLEDRVLGRNVAQFEAGAFTADVTNETDHFAFAFDASQFDLVKSADAAEPDTLELGHIHAWTGPVWTWASHEDENHITVYDTATATFTCSRCGDTADVTDEILDVLHTDPKCETAGSNKYTAVVEFEGETYTDSRTVTLPAIGHDWEFNGFTWTGSDETGYTAAVANYECRNDSAHKRTVNAALTTEGSAPTCEEPGEVVYTTVVTAATSLDGAEHTDTKTVAPEALGHDWGTPVWNWTEATVDGETVFTRVTCTVPCKRDHAHDLVYATDFEGAMHVMLTETNRTPAGCTTDGSVTYVATVDANTDLTDTRTVTLPATGHDWDFENIEWSWTKEIVDGEAVWHVTATVTCRNNETHKWTEEATVTGPEIVTPAGETTPGEQKYTAEVTFTDDAGSHGPYYDYKTEPIPPYGHTHEWTGPEWTWEYHTENGITVYDSATATFTCTGCGDVVNVPDDELDVVTVSAKCEQTGSAEYTAAVEFGGNTYTDSRTVELPALGHDWVFKGFTWTGNDTDGYTAAVANYECRNDPTEKRTVDAVVSAETTAPTCLSTGKTVYTAVVSAENSLDGKRHTEDKTVVIPTVDHNWTGPAWTWFETTDGWNASAVFTCDVTDPAHIELPPVTVTYEETVHPTVDQPGKGVYTAVTVFGGETYTDTKEVDIDPLGHKFVGPEWTWFGSDEEGWEAEATFTCINETGHIEKPPVTMSNEITKRPTCEGTGTRTYTATTVFEGKTYTATKDVTLPPIGHDWGTPEGVWHGRDITVTVTCRNDPSHVLILDADVTEVVLEEPWCTTAGLSHLTATVIFQGETYTWEKDYVLPALGHNWGPWVVVREATFEEDGLERRECLRCGLVEERVIPWNGEATREIQFVVSYPMHYTAHMRNNEYYSVYSETIPVIYWYPDQPLQFHILIYSNWGLAGYIVSANGKEIKPDENGVYTIPPGEEKVQINCDPIVTATSDGQELCEYCGKVHPSTVWGFLVGMMHRLFAYIKKIGG